MSRKLHFATVPVSPGDRNSRDISDRSRHVTNELTFRLVTLSKGRGEASWRRGLETPRASRITRFKDSNCGAGKNDVPTEGERG